ncbi:polymorphic toxin-type HINT domain-containing protein [Moraxella bovoculi]|uniref:polymorphic toxin-type HINT domain-containing protein n=1 Tax=Moraxella bovoculi TaxID=386891 RepID=UPI0009B93F86|nr:polymorphic toxin-type HINT domain-containing protein [Moraxella bovoculi]
MTGAGAAIVAIAVAYATGGLGSELSASIVSSATNAGIAASTAGTLGAMSSAAFGSLVSTASISLINNQGDIKATLKELGSKQNIKQLTFAIASAGIGSKINQTLSKSLGVGDIANSHNFSHKISKGIANATSTALLESAIYGTSLEKSLIKNLRGEVANAVASEIFTDYVKPLDKDTLIDNITHKLAAGLTGCLSAKAAGNRCEAGSIGAVVGEMVGDWLVTGELRQRFESGEIKPGSDDYNKVLNTARLTAGAIALLYDFDVDTAANEAGVAVENNALYKEHIDTYLKLIEKNRRTKKFDEYTFIKEVIMPAMAENSEQTYKEFDACISSPQASSCLPRIQNRLKQTDYTALLREVSIIPEAYNQVLAYAQRNHDLAYCNESSGNGCLNLAQFKRNVESGVFFPAISARGVRTPTPKPETASKTSRNTATCTTGTVCFTAGTLIETDKGLKAIETFTGGELIWTRNDITLEYGYRPVVATKATPNQPIFQVTVKNHQGDIETLQTTAEHPFWIKDTGWLKASLLEQGMILLDRNNQEVEVISQFVLPNHTDTVYNIEVDDFHTYHVGRLGVWVHNADCCGVALSTLESHVEKSARGTGKLHNITEPELKQLILGIGYNKDELLKAKAILEHSIKVRKAEKPKFGGRLDKRHNDRIKMEQGILDKVNSMLKELE